MAAKVVYKVRVLRTSGVVQTAKPDGVLGWVVLADAEAVARNLAGQVDAVRVLVTEERVVREYNGPGMVGNGQAKQRGTTLF